MVTSAKDTVRRWRAGIGVAALCAVVVGCGSGSTEPSKSSAPPMGNSRFPLLTNYGGSLLSPMRLVAVVAANDSLRDSLFAFANALPRSQWWSQVATPFGISPSATAYTVTGPPLTSGTQLTLTDVKNYVQHAAIDSAGYTANGYTVFLIFLPPGVTCGPPASCSTYQDFHIPFGAGGALAIITHPAAPDTSVMTSMTISASHEVIESATDPGLNTWKLVSPFLPWTASPWGLDDGGTFEETADMCQGTRYLEGGFYYQRAFSNQAAALGGDPCVPAIAEPYFNVTTSQAWYATSTGDDTIPITGWSTGSAPAWEIGWNFGPSTQGLAAPTLNFLSCPDTVMFGAARVCAINNGGTAMLHVVLPPGSVKESYFTIQIFSARANANGVVAGPNDDVAHHWIFGVYVP